MSWGDTGVAAAPVDAPHESRSARPPSPTQREYVVASLTGGAIGAFRGEKPR